MENGSEFAKRWMEKTGNIFKKEGIYIDLET